MRTEVHILNITTGKELFVYDTPPQYLPREGEFIRLYLKGLCKVIKVVHETTYYTRINIFVELCH